MPRIHVNAKFLYICKDGKFPEIICTIHAQHLHYAQSNAH